MAKKIILKFTEVQIRELLNLRDTVEGMIGGASPDENGISWDTEMEKTIKTIDRMLKSNGYKRR